MNAESFYAPDPLRQQFAAWQRRVLLVAGGGVVLSLLGAFLNLDQFFRSYLVGFLFWLGISLGCLAWLLVYQLTGGNWGVVIRRFLETSGELAFAMAIFFLPLVFGLKRLYPWAHPDLVSSDPLLQHKQPYLNIPFFLVRAVIYFAVWLLLAWLLKRWSRRQPRSPDESERRRSISGVGLAAYGLTITFAAIDWLMSLEPHWFSSIFGMVIAAGEVLTALSFAIVAVALLARWEPLAQIITSRHINDLGNLLLSVVLLWSYLAFAQYLIIWSGNIPEEVVWYVHRLQGSWRWVALLILLAHFALPFGALLSGCLKQHGRSLLWVAATLLVMHWLYLFWLVAPAFHAGNFYLHWLDLVVPITLGALWVALFLWRMRLSPLLPDEAAQVEEAQHGRTA